jgi:hypothetical protein
MAMRSSADDCEVLPILSTMISRTLFAPFPLSLSHTRLDCTWIKIIPEDGEIKFIGKRLRALLMSHVVVGGDESGVPHVLNRAAGPASQSRYPEVKQLAGIAQAVFQSPPV